MNKNSKNIIKIKKIGKKESNKNQDCEQIVSDVLGSYTGVPDEGMQPVQDVDDL